MTTRTLALGSIAATFQYVIAVATAFVMAPFLIGVLGQGQYGFWELVLGLVGYLGLLDIGFGPAIARHVAVARGRGEGEDVLRTTRVGFVALMFAGTVGAAVIAIASLRPAVVFGDVPVADHLGTRVILLAAVTFFLTFARTAFTATLVGLERHYLVNFLRSAIMVVSAVATIAGIRASMMDPLLWLATVTTAAMLVEVIVFSTVLRAACGPGIVGFKDVRFESARNLVSFGAKSVGLMGASSLVQQGTLFLVAHILSAAAVAQYVFATRLIEYGRSLSYAIGFPLSAHFATALGRGGVAGAAASWRSTTRVFQFVTFGVAVAVTSLGIPFLARWLGEGYAEAARQPFYALCVGLFVQAIATNCNRVLVSLGRHGPAAGVAIALGLAWVPIAYFLIRAAGLLGAATAATLYVATQALVEMRLACRELGVSAIAHVMQTLGRYAFPAGLAGASGFAINHVSYPATYPALFLHGLVIAAVYAGAAFWTVMLPAERLALGEWIRGVWRRRLLGRLG